MDAVSSLKPWLIPFICVITCCLLPENAEAGLCTAVYENRCYKVRDEPASFDEAKRVCEAAKGKLAVINDFRKLLQVGPSLGWSQSYWIGLDSQRIKGIFQFHDGTVLDDGFNAWGLDQPNITAEQMGARCVKLKGQRFYNAPCATKSSFICQYNEIPSCNIRDVQIMNAVFDRCHKDHYVPTGMTLRISCRDGYILIGDEDVTCLQNGLWTKYPRCARGCPAPEVRENSYLLSPMQEAYRVGDKIEIACDDGFFTHGLRSKQWQILECQENGAWSPDARPCTNTDGAYSERTHVSRYGDRVSLRCDRDLSPREDGEKRANSWFKDGAEITHKQQAGMVIETETPVIMINNFTKSDEGVYSCHVRLGEKAVLELVSVFILRGHDCESSELVTSENVRVINFVESSNVVLSCGFVSDGPLQVLHWHHGDTRIVTDNHRHVLPDGKLLVLHAETTDAGVYTCQAHSPMRCPKKYVTHLKVKSHVDISGCGLVDPEAQSQSPWLVMFWDPIGRTFCYGAAVEGGYIVTSAKCTGQIYSEVMLFSEGHVIQIREEDKTLFVPNPIDRIAIYRLNPNAIPDGFTPLCLPADTEDLQREKSCAGDLDPIEGIASAVTNPPPAKLHSQSVFAVTVRSDKMFLVDGDNCINEFSSTPGLFCAELANQTADGVLSTGSPFAVKRKNGKWYLFGLYKWARKESGNTHDLFSKTSHVKNTIRSFTENI